MPSDEVATWLISADVLVCPYRVDEFTLSLDAVKSYGYLATDRPVVATPSSGFEGLRSPRLTVVDRAGFRGRCTRIEPHRATRPPATWDDRAGQFAEMALGRVVADIE